MTEGVRDKKGEEDCLNWFHQNLNTHKRYQRSANDIQCPCDTRLLRFDPRFAISRFDRKNRILCYASVQKKNNAVIFNMQYQSNSEILPT